MVPANAIQKTLSMGNTATELSNATEWNLQIEIGIPERLNKAD